MRLRCGDGLMVFICLFSGLMLIMFWLRFLLLLVIC